MAHITIQDIQRAKQQGRKIAMLTGYDYPMAVLLDRAGVDIVLVGDSLGMVVLGHEDTTKVTMADMIHHGQAVRRGVKQALMVVDMPYGSFHKSDQDTVANAKRLVEETGCEAVKLEWIEHGERPAQAIVNAGIPVMGHVGLTPQTASQTGGFGVRGKDPEQAKQILEAAQQLEDAGCFAVVLECIPDVLAQRITEQLTIPTIGIGAGVHCDGQVLVTHDMLGLFDRFTPKFVKRYTEGGRDIVGAVAAYIREVRAGEFPGEAQTYHVDAPTQKPYNVR